jgi:hypothetical protein
VGLLSALIVQLGIMIDCIGFGRFGTVFAILGIPTTVISLNTSKKVHLP